MYILCDGDELRGRSCRFLHKYLIFTLFLTRNYHINGMAVSIVRGVYVKNDTRSVTFRLRVCRISHLWGIDICNLPNPFPRELDLPNGRTPFSFIWLVPLRTVQRTAGQPANRRKGRACIGNGDQPIIPGNAMYRTEMEHSLSFSEPQCK